MRDVVIIGGGLSGLAAAVELETLKVPYRLIEVKKRLGGSIASLQEAGFTLDTGGFAFPISADWSFLHELGLQDALIDVYDVHRRRSLAFKAGTQTLVDALVKRLKTGTIIHRMAVSSLGYWEGRYTLCLENGLMLDAAALIVASPAKHAERMFRTLTPELSLRLLHYGYDTITRVALGFAGEIGDPGQNVWGDMAVPYYYTTNDLHRVPSAHTLVQLGVRFPLDRTTPEILVHTLLEQLRWPMPIISHVAAWPEADPLPPHTDHFRENMAALEALLPEGAALAGSDYHGLGLAERIASGRSAARKIANWLSYPQRSV
jgi:protoporphyrinogen oxidase